jgi:hypothetical protein
MPDLATSLKHLAIIGKFSLERSSDHKRPIEISVGNRAAALGEIGFELVYGPKILKINGIEHNSFDIKSPLAAEEHEKSWFTKTNRDGSTTAVLPGSIPLVTDNPIVEAIKMASDPREIGGKLFCSLLTDLDGLRPFWHPHFDRALSSAAFHWIKNKIPNHKYLTDGKLREVLFAPEVNRRLLSCLRATPANIRRGEEAFKEGLQMHPDSEKFPAELPAYLFELRAALAGPDTDPLTLHLLSLFSPATEASRAAKKELSQFLPKGKRLDEWWREYHGHALRVQTIAGCEPLFAFIIWWFLGKASGETDTDNIAKTIYRELYVTPDAKKKKIAILPDAVREEDNGIFTSEWNKLIDGYEKAHVDQKRVVKEIVNTSRQTIFQKIADLRNPPRSFKREEARETAVRLFEKLLSLGVPEAARLDEEPSKLAAELREGYRAFEAIYGEELTVEMLQEEQEKQQGAAKQLWKSVVKLLQDKSIKGIALAKEFRIEYNTRWARSVHEKFEEKANEIEGDLAEKGSRILNLYSRGLATLAADESNVSVPGGSHLGVPHEATQSVSLASHQGPPSAKPGIKFIPQQPASPQTPPETIDGRSLESSSSTFDESPEQPGSAFDTLADFTLQQLNRDTVDYKPDEDVWKHLIRDRSELASSRQAITEALARQDTPEFASLRGALRALLFVETVLTTAAETSPLANKDSSLGVKLLVELICAIGAVPNGEDRTNLATPTKDPRVVDGVKSVELYRVYPLPDKVSEATAKLDSDVKYWDVLVKSIFENKEYIDEVSDVKRLIESIEDPTVHITVHNQTLGQHLNSQVHEHVFASPKTGTPPSLVWLTTEARVDPSNLSKLQSAHDQMIDAVQDPASQVSTSYPLYLLRQVALAPTKMLTGPLLPPTAGAPWDAPELIYTLLGAGTSLEADITLGKAAEEHVQHKTGLRMIGPRKKDTYYSQLIASTFGQQLLQSRILSQALFALANRRTKPDLWLCVKSALDAEPLRDLLRAKYRQRDAQDNWGGLSDSSPTKSIRSLGWQTWQPTKQEEVTVDLLTPALVQRFTFWKAASS